MKESPIESEAVVIRLLVYDFKSFLTKQAIDWEPWAIWSDSKNQLDLIKILEFRKYGSEHETDLQSDILSIGWPSVLLEFDISYQLGLSIQWNLKAAEACCNLYEVTFTKYQILIAMSFTLPNDEVI